MALDHADHIAHLRREVALFADALRTGPLDAPVASCPGWALRDLANHLGRVHGWAAQCARTGEKTMFPDDGPVPDDELVDWYTAEAAALADVLDGLDPDGPTWHLFVGPRVNRLWSRRQAHETQVHRWDAETAIGNVTSFDPVLASDGVDEYFELVVPRVVKRDARALPEGSLHVHCTDTAGEWLVHRADDGALVMVREHAKGDAALRGAAGDLLLALWGRGGTTIDVVGDPAVAAAWLALGGN